MLLYMALVIKMKLYDENGNIKEIKNSRLFTKTDNAKIYRLGNGDVIKLWKKYPDGNSDEVLKIIKDNNLYNFCKIKEIYYNKSKDKAVGFRTMWYESENIDILLEDSYYTLINLYAIFESMGILCNNNVWINDLHTDNVILGKKDMTIIDTDLYTINRFLDRDSLVSKNINAITNLFYNLYLEALKKHPELYNERNIELIKGLFKNVSCEEIDKNSATLLRCKRPINYLRK